MSAAKGFFKSVKALPGYRLEIEMETDTHIVFDFNSRLDTARFGALRDEVLFQSAFTDGDYIWFKADEYHKLKITAKEFMDLVLVDRTGGGMSTSKNPEENKEQRYYVSAPLGR